MSPRQILPDGNHSDIVVEVGPDVVVLVEVDLVDQVLCLEAVLHVCNFHS